MPLQPGTAEYLDSCPFFAAVQGKNEQEQNLFFSRYDRLPETARQFLLAPETADAVVSMERQGLFPQTHQVAISKLVALIVLGDVTIPSVPQILVKLGIPQESAQGISSAIATLVAPALQSKNTTLDTLQKIPPLTLSKPTPSPQEPARNIIDLRKPPTSS